MSCGTSALNGLVRGTNVIVALFGGALVLYGIVFAAKTATFGAPAAVPFVLGLIDIVFGVMTVTCCYQRLFFLRLYLLVGGLLWLTEFIIAILFLVPTTQQQIIAAMNLSDDVAGWVNDNISSAGYILLALTAAKGLAIGFVLWQSFAVHRGFDESAFDKGTSKLLGGDKYGAMKDEGELEAGAARYREKHAAMYDRYNIKR
jgi:hypothetical protein